LTTLDRETAVLEALTAYLAGAAPLSSLADRTATALFELAYGATGPLPELVRTIELRLAEYSGNDLSEEELRNHLLELTHDYSLELILDEDSQTRQRSGTTSVTVGEAHSWSRPGTPLAAAFA